MRIPGSKVYRAFPELDRFTDEQCRGWVKGAWTSDRLRLIAAQIAGCVAGAALAALLFLIFIVFADISGAARSMASANMPAFVVFGVIVPGAGFAAAVLLMRDLALRRAVCSRLKSTRCGRCNYQLLGLPIKGTTITCAECGFVLDLREVGLKAEDFMGEGAGD